MPKFLKIALPIIILAVGFLIFKALQATRPEQASVEIQERVWRVEVEAAQPQALAPELDLYGRVETPELLKVAASGQARVAEVPVRDGDRVVAGQLLVRLDEQDFLPRLRQAQAEAAELRAQVSSERNRFETDQKALEQEKKLVEIASDGVERAERLTKQRVGSETDLDVAEEVLARQVLAVSNREMSISDHPARLQALEARLDRSHAVSQEVELAIERATVEAPYDGVVAGVEVTVGDQVKRDAVLLRMYSPGRLEVRARIPAPYQEEIRAALASGARLTAAADVGATRVPLNLKRLAGEAHPSGVDGLFAVEGETDALRLGQMLSVRLARPERADAVAVPFQAVYRGRRVYKVVESRMRGVEVERLGGASDGNGGEQLLVRSPDLVAGDMIVVTHMPNAVEGLRVEAIQ